MQKLKVIKMNCPICKKDTETASDVGACSICGWDGESVEEFHIMRIIRERQKELYLIDRKEHGNLEKREVLEIKINEVREILARINLWRIEQMTGFVRVKNMHDNFYKE